MRRTSIALVLAASLAGVCPAHAQAPHRFTVDDLVAREGIGAVRTSPDGRWVVVERQARHDSASAYRFQTRIPWLLSSLEIHSVTDAGEVRRIGSPGRDAGYVSGPFSPDGARMVVYRLTDTTFRLGILTLATGSVDWRPITPESSQFGRSVAWRDNDTLIVMARPTDDLPIQMRVGSKTQERTEALWRIAASGRGASSVYIPSGETRDQRTRPLASALIMLEIGSGRQRVLAQGEWFDMALSPDGTHLAALENGEDIQPDPARPLRVGDPIRRHRIALFDLDTGAVHDPLPDEDIAMYLLSWSPDSRRLVVFGRSTGGPDFDVAGRFWTVSAAGDVRRLDLGEDKAWIERTWDGVAIPLASWMGSDPLVQVRSPAQDRLWRRNGVRVAHYPVVEPGERILSIDGQTRVQRMDGVYALGGAKPLVSGRMIDQGQAGDGGNPDAWNPSPITRGEAIAVKGACLTRATGGAPRCFTPLTTEDRVIAAAGTGDALVTQALSPSGDSAVRLFTAAGVRTLTRVNTAWRDVAWGRIEPIAHTGPDGQALTSWLLLPAGLAPGEKPPVVVDLYPGATLRSAPASIRPGSSLLQNNPAVIAGGGYAVLMANLPWPTAGSRSGDLGRRVLDIVDEAGRRGLIDPDRVALIGHSYGAYSVLRAATQTDRFRAVIASSGYPDLTRSMELPPFYRVAPEEGVPVGQLAGWAETGQGGIGEFATAPQAYVDDSPLFSVDRLTAPTLLVESDLDNSRMGTLFSALYRLDREAALLTYYGEGHVYASPGNLRDLYAHIFDWLGRYLGPPARLDPLGPGPGPNFEDRVEKVPVAGLAPG
jgi:dipeptidyl aminopeptidase/acylaminoacyl peptidase